MQDPRARWRRTVVVLAGLLVLVAGCELAVTSELVVERDGSGSVGLTLALDEVLLAELDGAGIDATAELAAAVAATPGWELTREAVDGGLQVTASHTADDPAALTAALRDLTAGLSDDDPALEVDLELSVDEDGAARVAGTASLRGPAGPGVVDEPELPDAATMAALTAEHVTATVAVTLPAAADAHDADVADGRTLRWQVPVGTVVPVAAAAPPPSPWTAERLAAVAAALLAATALTVGWTWRRRRAHGPAGR